MMWVREHPQPTCWSLLPHFMFDSLPNLLSASWGELVDFPSACISNPQRCVLSVVVPTIENNLSSDLLVLLARDSAFYRLCFITLVWWNAVAYYSFLFYDRCENENLLVGYIIGALYKSSEGMKEHVWHCTYVYMYVCMYVCMTLYVC